MVHFFFATEMQKMAMGMRQLQASTRKVVKLSGKVPVARMTPPTAKMIGGIPAGAKVKMPSLPSTFGSTTGPKLAAPSSSATKAVSGIK